MNPEPAITCALLALVFCVIIGGIYAAIWLMFTGGFIKW